MSEVSKGSSAQASTTKQAKPRPEPTKTAHVPGICSKTGDAINFYIGYFAGEKPWIDWQLIDIVRPKTVGSGSNGPEKPLEKLPTFGLGDHSAWCPHCHIRVKNGPMYFECGLCNRLNCMGSFTTDGKKIHVVCGKCKNGGWLQSGLTSVKGSTATSSKIGSPSRLKLS